MDCWRGGAGGAGGGVKWQKILSVMLHIWGTIHHITVIYVCEMTVSSCVFSILFLKILFFWVHRGVKGQKTVQNDKKLCQSHSISHESYIIQLSFVVQVCKLVISWGVFFNVKILIFPGCLGAERAKNGPKCQKFLSVTPYISGTIYDLHLWYTCMYKRIISPEIFFIFFQNSDIWDH